MVLYFEHVRESASGILFAVIIFDKVPSEKRPVTLIKRDSGTGVFL